jgi:hypothetical protein
LRVFTDDGDRIVFGSRFGTWQSALRGREIIRLDQFKAVPVTGDTF